MALRDKITPANVLAFARAGIEVARSIQSLDGQGYERIVVPSRGAVPILDVARAYYRTIVVPYMPLDDRLKTIKQHSFGLISRTFHIPFTADAGHMGVAGLDTAQIRQFWARTVAAITRGLMNDPTYRFFRFVRDEVCKIGHHDEFEWKMRTGRFVFIDTVVSGKAVTEIVDAFDREGLSEVHYMLIADENGARMREPYKRRIAQLVAEGRATLIKVPSLFTEDQGPGVSGVWSVVVPKLMDLARTESTFTDGVIGAGLYYWEVSLRPNKSNLAVTVGNAKLHVLLYQAMHVSTDPNQVAEDLDLLGTNFKDEMTLEGVFHISRLHGFDFEGEVERYLQHVEQTRLFDQKTTSEIARPFVMAGVPGLVADIDASSSHCLRLHISEDDAARLIRQFNNSLQRPYWADDECIERA